MTTANVPNPTGDQNSLIAAGVNLDSKADHEEVFRHLSIVYRNDATNQFYNTTKVTVDNNTFYAPNTTEC